MQATNKKAASFSPPFDDFTSYGNNKDVPPRHHKPYGRRASFDQAPKTLSPDLNSSNWLITPASSRNSVLEAKKEEYRRRKSVLPEALPISRKTERRYQLVFSQDNNSEAAGTTSTATTASHPSLRRTRIQVLQEDENHQDEEEQLPPTPVASFSFQARPGDKFPWAFVNNDTGLEMAFFKYKTTDFASHLESPMSKKKHLECLELYGKTPLFENQKYRKRGNDNHEIIYHWASTKIRHASKVLGLNLFSKSIEMTTKHETAQDYKIGKSSDCLRIYGPKSNKTTAVLLEPMDDDGRVRMTIGPTVDPALMIIFLAMTECFKPFVAGGTASS